MGSARCKERLPSALPAAQWFRASAPLKKLKTAQRTDVFHSFHLWRRSMQQYEDSVDFCNRSPKNSSFDSELSAAQAPGGFLADGTGRPGGHRTGLRQVTLATQPKWHLRTALSGLKIEIRRSSLRARRRHWHYAAAGCAPLGVLCIQVRHRLRCRASRVFVGGCVKIERG